MNHRAIINIATPNAWYPKGQQRLRQSLQGENFLGYIGEHSVNAPKHSQVPYAFKPFALDWLRQKGFTSIMWLDASMYAVKSLEPLWDIIETKGWLMEEGGHWLGRWCNERALRNMGITREQANAIPMYSAGMTGLDLNNEKAVNFLNEWLRFAKDGETFKGSWQDHRHDMSVASFLAWKLGMDYECGGTYLSYIGEVYGKPSDTSIIHLAGMN